MFSRLSFIENKYEELSIKIGDKSRSHSRPMPVAGNLLSGDKWRSASIENNASSKASPFFSSVAFSIFLLLVTFGQGEFNK